MTPGPDLGSSPQLVLTPERRLPAVAARRRDDHAGAVQVTMGPRPRRVMAAEHALFTALRWMAAAVLLGMAALACVRPERPDPRHRPTPIRQPGVRSATHVTGPNPKVGVS